MAPPIKINIQKEFLYQKYIIEELSMSKIATICICSEDTIMRLLKKYNIPRRTSFNVIASNTYVSGMLGKKHSETTKSKMRLKALGRKNSSEAKKKMSETRINNPEKYSGKAHPLYGITRKDISGENNSNWRGGISSIYRKFRCHTKYKEWRTACFVRDDYTCTICHNKGVELNVDHIKPYAVIFLEYNIKTIEEFYACNEMWDLNNGRTLCIDCHRKTDTWGGKTKEMISKINKKAIE